MRACPGGHRNAAEHCGREISKVHHARAARSIACCTAVRPSWRCSVTSRPGGSCPGTNSCAEVAVCFRSTRYAKGWDSEVYEASSLGQLSGFLEALPRAHWIVIPGCSNRRIERYGSQSCMLVLTPSFADQFWPNRHLESEPKNPVTPTVLSGFSPIVLQRTGHPQDSPLLSLQGDILGLILLAISEDRDFLSLRHTCVFMYHITSKGAAWKRLQAMRRKHMLAQLMRGRARKRALARKKAPFLLWLSAPHNFASPPPRWTR